MNRSSGARSTSVSWDVSLLSRRRSRLRVPRHARWMRGERPAVRSRARARAGSRFGARSAEVRGAARSAVGGRRQRSGRDIARCSGGWYRRGRRRDGRDRGRGRRRDEASARGPALHRRALPSNRRRRPPARLTFLTKAVLTCSKPRIALSLRRDLSRPLSVLRSAQLGCALVEDARCGREDDLLRVRA
jgi:hypothetical protein